MSTKKDAVIYILYAITEDLGLPYQAHNGLSVWYSWFNNVTVVVIGPH